MTIDQRMPTPMLFHLAGALVLAYLAALGTVLAPSDAVSAPIALVAQLVGAGIPLAVGFGLARSFTPGSALARLGAFVVLAAMAGAFTAAVMADLLLEDPTADTGRFVAGSTLFVALLVGLAALTGACMAWTYRRSMGRMGLHRGTPEPDRAGVESGS